MVYLRQLLKFTDSEHFLSVAVAERPEPVDGSGLADLHVDAGGVRLHRDRPAFPGQILIYRSVTLVTQRHYLYQFVHKGVAASQSLALALLPSHLKTPTFCVV